MDFLKNSLWGNVDWNDFESGGETCYNYMSQEFRLFISFVMIPIYFYLIKRYIIIDYSCKALQKPNYIEKVIGCSGIVVYLLTIFMKIHSRGLIYILNPCHTIGLLQSLVLLSKNSIHMKIISDLTFNLLFCGLMAILTPLLVGLNKLEVFFFFYEHYEILIINPIVIIFGGRYVSDNTFSLKTSIISSCFFGLYQRLFLFLIGSISFVNLNFILCPSNGDPFVKYIGKWYYILSDLYLWFAGFIVIKIGYILFWSYKKLLEKKTLIKLNKIK